ncbi:MAG: hypothetical protein BGO77_01810 [Caedibacter sp. 37-49]|nr:MAG: hypothetical protein BGO77_01810 [Caedibacter sp. 37-49]
MKSKVGLVDCNNFFVSCERVFPPDLKEKPLVVLSNNDGCAISRSNEAKALNIRMGEPYFKFVSIAKKHDIKIFSSNFELYADLSRRVMATIKTMVPLINVYSIDEAFLDLSAIPDHKIEVFCQELQERVQQWTGIPISIGVSYTKTLAKVANICAKREKGIRILLKETEIDEVLSSLPVKEVWGVGHKYTACLKNHHIETALDLKKVPLKWVRQFMSVIGERIVWELNGQVAYPLETQEASKKMILVSRSFKKPLSSFEDLSSFICAFTEKAAEKLRKENKLATHVYIFIKTDRFHQKEYYANGYEINLDRPSDETLTLIRASQAGLKKIFYPKHQYKKAGICFTRLIDASHVQYSLFSHPLEKRRIMLTKTIDQIKRKFGSKGIFYGDFSLKAFELTQREHLSPCYTTKWGQLAKVL